MSKQGQERGRPENSAKPGGIRSGLALVIAAAVIGCAVLVARPWKKKAVDQPVAVQSVPTRSNPATTNAASLTTSQNPGTSASNSPISPSVAPATARTTSPPPVAAATARAAASPASRQLVSALSQFDDGPLTPERAGQWKEALGQLIQGGAGSVPAIREFLESNKDVRFNAAGAQMLGSGSVREALINALGQMGGPEAIALLSQTLQTAAVPRDVALIAMNLEQLEPGVHRLEAVAAARQTLAMASTGGLPGADVGPLFEVLMRLGGPEVVSDLQQSANRWGYYASTALAQLPDNAGVPYLTVLALDEKQSSSLRLKAFEGLAQAAQQSAEARATILAQAQSGGIAANWWPYLAPFLGGGQYQVVDGVTTAPPSRTSDLRSIRIGSTQESLYIVPGPWTQEQLAAQSAFLDQLQTAAANNQAALAAIQQARADLARRVPVATPAAPAAQP